MHSSRCPYGPAHEQPPRAWMPNRSFEQRDDELVVQHPAAVVDRGPRRSAAAGASEVAEDLQVRVAAPAVQRPQPASRAPGRGSGRCRPPPSARRPARPGSTRRSPGCRPPRGRPGRPGRARRPGRRTRSCRRRARVGTGWRTSSRRTTRTPGVCGPPTNLCGEKTTASLASTPPAAVSRIRIGTVRRGGRVVPDRQRAVPVQQRGDPGGVGQDAGDVRGGREAADPQRPVPASRAAGPRSSAGVDAAVRGPRRSRPPRPPTRARAARWSGARTGRRGPPAAAPGRRRARPAGDCRAAGSACPPPAVAPEPQKITRSSSVPPTARWITWRACSRSRVVRRPVRRALAVGVGVPGQHPVADRVLDEVRAPGPDAV